MIVITEVGISPEADQLVLKASWLDGTAFQYVISKQGIEVQGFGERALGRRRSSIDYFRLIAHKDVWTLLVEWRLGVLQKSWEGVQRLLSQRHGRIPLTSDEIGTAFGLLPASKVGETLRNFGYRVEEIEWNDLLEQRLHPQPA
ncbi:MAG: hypothetical protein KatS3mg110_1223 [Pirellulaceae bacterium]|nr:MAG: hypothetical protein KatS3mg110_1223 [Pirellulaceae bacterium]